MTEQVGEEEQQAQGHPAWQEILEVIPEDLRPVIEPKLKEWDQGVNGKLQAVRSEYEPLETYKPLVENNVSLDYVQKALWLAHELENNPEGLVRQAIDHYGLDSVLAAQTSSSDPAGNDEDDDEDDENDFGDFDITNHPQFKAMQKQAEELEKWRREQQEAQETEQAKSALEKTLDDLHNQYDIDGPDGNKIPGFDNLYVAALMAQGVEPEDAIKSYNDTVNERARMLAGIQQDNETPPPVVMGGDGNTGSGIPNEPVNMHTMKDNDVSDLVQQIIDQSNKA